MIELVKLRMDLVEGFFTANVRNLRVVVLLLLVVVIVVVCSYSQVCSNLCVESNIIDWEGFELYACRGA